MSSARLSAVARRPAAGRRGAARSGAPSPSAAPCRRRRRRRALPARRRHRLRARLGRRAAQRAHQRQRREHEQRRLAERPREALAGRAGGLADDLLVEARLRLEAVLRSRPCSRAGSTGSPSRPAACGISQSSTMSSISSSANQDMCACSAPPKVAIRIATPIAAPSWRAVFSTPEASPSSWPGHRAHRAHVQRREADPHARRRSSAGRAGCGCRPRRRPRSTGRNDTHSIPTAITISAGLAISPGGRVSAARPTKRPHDQAAERDRDDRERRLELACSPRGSRTRARAAAACRSRPRAKNSIPMFALRNCRLASSPGVIIGSGARRSHQKNSDAEQDRPLHQAEPERQVAAERVGLDQRHREEQDRAAQQQHAAHVHLLADRRSGPRSRATSAAPARCRGSRTGC